jgi:hypothetical protein
MRAVALLVFSFVVTSSIAGCLDAQVDDGVLLCSDVPGRACPRNYYCANNNYCYRDGHGPGTTRDLSMPVATPSADFATPPGD